MKLKLGGASGNRTCKFEMYAPVLILLHSVYSLIQEPIYESHCHCYTPQLLYIHVDIWNINTIIFRPNLSQCRNYALNKILLLLPNFNQDILPYERRQIIFEPNN